VVDIAVQAVGRRVVHGLADRSLFVIIFGFVADSSDGCFFSIYAGGDGSLFIITVYLFGYRCTVNRHGNGGGVLFQGGHGGEQDGTVLVHRRQVAHRVVVILGIMACGIGNPRQAHQLVVDVAGGMAVGVGYRGYLSPGCIFKVLCLAQGVGDALQLAQGIVVILSDPP